LPNTAEQKAENYKRQEFNKDFATTEITRLTRFHRFLNLFYKFDVAKRCKMLEVKKNQHLGCGKVSFPQPFPQLPVDNFLIENNK
jgi:hypothetical protein